MKVKYKFAGIFLYLIVFISLNYLGPANAQEPNYQPKDLVLLISKASKIKLSKNLDGQNVLAPSSKKILSRGDEISLCNVWYTKDYEDLPKEMAIRLFDLKVKESFEMLGATFSGTFKLRSCGADRGDGVFRVGGNEAELLLLQYKALSAVDFEEFEPVMLITHAEMQEAQTAFQNSDAENIRKLAELENSYSDLAKNNSDQFLGSINLSYPDKYEEVQLCTLDISGAEAVPFVEYPFFDFETTFTSGMVDAMRASRKQEFERKEIYQKAFTGLEEFFQSWQSSPETCNVFVAYPKNLFRFIEAAKNVNENFKYEFNQLTAVAQLRDQWAQRRDFENWEQNRFATSLGIDAALVKNLASFKITSLDEFKNTAQLMNDEGYDNGNEVSTVLKYLEDQKAGAEKGLSATDVRLKREETARLAAERREKQRQAEIAERNKKRQQRIASGNGEFVHYEDGSCTEKEKERVCISKEQLVELCRKVDGYYNPVFGTIFSAASMMDYKLRELEKNMGRNAYSDAETYVSKGGDCIFSFRASGQAGGDSINRTYYCKVNQIYGKDGDFGTKGLNALSCTYR